MTNYSADYPHMPLLLGRNTHPCLFPPSHCVKILALKNSSCLTGFINNIKKSLKQTFRDIDECIPIKAEALFPTLYLALQVAQLSIY